MRFVKNGLMKKSLHRRARKGRPPSKMAASHAAIMDAVYFLLQKKSVRDLTMEAVAERAKVGKINVDENQSVTSRYNIRGIPTLLLFNRGQVQEQIKGATSKDAIVKMLEKHLQGAAP